MEDKGSFRASRSIPSEGQPTSVAAVLNAAADLLEKPGAWTQGNYALDDEGNDCDSWCYLGEPACFCAIGAINTAAGLHPGNGSHHEALDAFGRFLGDETIHCWNDAPGRTQAEVVAALREAARKADAAERANKLAGYEAEGRMNQGRSLT